MFGLTRDIGGNTLRKNTARVSPFPLLRDTVALKEKHHGIRDIREIAEKERTMQIYHCIMCVRNTLWRCKWGHLG